MLYQFGTKFRDEIRPRFGIMRAREFLMKDAYSFHADEKDLERYYLEVFEAYKRICDRCGFKYTPVEATSGAIGGSFSHEFMVLAETGEERDSFVRLRLRTVSSALLGTMVGSLLWGGRRIGGAGGRCSRCWRCCSCLGSGLCAGLELVCLVLLPLAGRRGRRRGLSRLPHVYHRDRSRPTARTAGGREPVEHRGGDPGGLFLELPGGPRGGRRPSEHVAVDVRGDDRARGGVPGDRAADPGKPSLAG